MAIKRRFTSPIQVVVDDDTRAEIEEIAEREDVSKASVIRDVLVGVRPSLGERPAE